jgi:hypothetical protein
LKVPSPALSQVRNRPFSDGQASMVGVQPNSTRLAVPWLSFGKNWFVGDERSVVRMPTCVSIAVIAWHTASRQATLTQSSTTEKPFG